MREEQFPHARILIIDDERFHIDFLTTILGNAGYATVKGLTDPRRAITAFEDFQPDIVILDLSMPNVSGLTVLKQLRAVIPAETYLPIIVVTADTSAESRQEALTTGANDFVIKPYESFEMVLRVSNLLQTRFLSLKTEERSRAALRQEEERFRAVFQQSAVGMTLTDASGRFMQVNSAFCEFLGYTAAELEKMFIADVTDPADEEATRLQLDELRAGTRQTLDVHKRYRRKDGGTAWGHVSGVFISMKTGSRFTRSPSFKTSRCANGPKWSWRAPKKNGRNPSMGFRICSACSICPAKSCARTARCATASSRSMEISSVSITAFVIVALRRRKMSRPVLRCSQMAGR
jgi:PAS domain S-box-containing protein